ncbi:pantoate--beta-alanine ligase [Granulosicoccaceae sp. 1_MG-2023]|nr:pantoate--beta-alanine ligase [Granulosicoccaceae sp. 1_MG-2023]
MQVMQDIDQMRAIVRDWKKQGLRVAFVPTMGNLHDGHLSLIRLAQEKADKVVASIYVNPLQFDRPDDLSAYPRTLQADLDHLEADGVDLVFTPDDKTIYPDGIEMSTKVDVPVISTILCGAHRPGHFVGVATVVCKLFNMVAPDVAVFGEKDFQQLLLIRRMAQDLNLPVTIVGAPTRREASGLAMSSRNNYLTAAEKEQAAGLYRMLRDAADKLIDAGHFYPALEQEGAAQLEAGGFVPDYVSVRRAVDLQIPSPQDKPEELVILCAAILGKARLIDNIQISRYLAER